MRIKRLNEQLRKCMYEDGKKVYTRGYMNGAEDPEHRVNYTVYEDDYVTVNVMGVDIDYIVMHTEFDGEVDKSAQEYGRRLIADKTTYKNAVEAIKEKIRQEIANQVASKCGLEITSFGGGTVISIPESAEYR